jgi:hypothetical protein
MKKHGRQLGSSWLLTVKRCTDMRIQEKDVYHGAALTQIVEHPSFKALNKADDKYGHYQVNHDRRIIAKYSTGAHSPWQFTFSANDIRTVREDVARKDCKAFVCLTCGRDTVCMLNQREIAEVLNLSIIVQQWITVEVPKGGSIHVRGTNGNCRRSIAHSSFPNKVFS